MTPHLSICIATLNRARFLEETLDGILGQANDEVEIVIVDGASTDATPEVVRGLQQRFPHIRYIRREKAMGVDRDFDAAVEHARGDYCWLLCDDDLLKPDAVERVLSGVRDGHALLVVNADVWDAGFSRRLESRRMQLDADRVYPPSGNEALFADTAEYLSFIGGVVIRRDIWMGRKREPFFGSEFIHVGVIFQAPLPGTALVISDPLISIRYGVAQWSARSFDIWMFRWPELVWSLPGLSDAVKRRVTPREPWRLSTNLLTYRAMGAYSPDVYRAKVRMRIPGRAGRVVPFLVSMIPGRALNLLGTAYFSLFHRRALMPLVDLENSRFRPFRKPGKESGRI